MAPRYIRFIYWWRTLYNKIYALPMWLRWSIGSVIVLLGVINLVNPLINGMFLILVGSSLLSLSSYRFLRKKRHLFKKKYDFHKRFPKKKRKVTTKKDVTDMIKK